MKRDEPIGFTHLAAITAPQQTRRRRASGRDQYGQVAAQDGHHERSCRGQLGAFAIPTTSLTLTANDNGEIEYRLAWARTYLKMMGLLVNSRRGVWTLTEEGRSVGWDDIPRLHRQVQARLREEQRAKRQAQRVKDSPGGVEQQADDEQDWRDQLLDVLMSVAPDAFERLSQRLLREAGFISATVTGRTGDGGIPPWQP